MDYRIREIRQEEYAILDDFLYEAIFIPDGVEAPPKSIIRQPELQVYVSDFDHCLVVEVDGEIIGAVWTRIMNDYGHVDDLHRLLPFPCIRIFVDKGLEQR